MTHNLLETEIADMSNTKTASRSLHKSHSQISDLKKDLSMYDIIAVLGKGASGIVYEAEHKQLGRKVAIKVLHPEFFDNDVQLQNFRSEAQIISSLKHENILSVYDFMEVNGHYYLIMELVKGQSLASIMIERDLSESEIISIIFGLLEGIRYTHNKNILHLDLKPSNIILTENNSPLIIDFGISRFKKTTLQEKNIPLVGTPYYMSPEQYAQDLNLVDFKSDIYALGIIFYQLLTNTLPFKGSRLDIVRKKVLLGNCISISHLNSSVSKSLEAIVLKMINRRVDFRYESAQAVIEDIRRYCSGRPVKALKYRFFSLVGKWMIRNKAISILSIIMLISLLSFGTYFKYKTYQETPQWIENVFKDNFNTDFSSRWSGFQAPFSVEKKKIDSKKFKSFFGNRINVASFKKDLDLLLSPNQVFSENIKIKFKVSINVFAQSRFGIFFNAPMGTKDKVENFGYLIYFEGSTVFLNKKDIHSAPLLMADYKFESDKIYLMEINVVGDLISLFINNKKIFEFQDFISQFSKKDYKMGYFSRKADLEIDDVMVSELRSPFYSLPLDIGNKFFQFGWIKKSIDEYSRVIAKFPDHPIAFEAYYLRGLAHLSLGREHQNTQELSNALKDFEYLITHDVRENIKGKAFYQKGICSLHLGKDKDAFQAFDESIKIHNISSLYSNIISSISAYTNKELNVLTKDNIEEAERAFKYLLKIQNKADSLMIEFPKKIINYYFESNQLKKSIVILNMLIKKYAYNENIKTFAIYKKGRAYTELAKDVQDDISQRNNFYNSAIICFQQVISNNNNKYLVYKKTSFNELSHIYRLKDEFQKATQIEKLANNYANNL